MTWFAGVAALEPFRGSAGGISPPDEWTLGSRSRAIPLRIHGGGRGTRYRGSLRKLVRTPRADARKARRELLVEARHRRRGCGVTQIRRRQFEGLLKDSSPTAQSDGGRAWRVGRILTMSRDKRRLVRDDPPDRVVIPYTRRPS